MKLSVLPLAVLLSLAAAQSLDALPPCAKQCANNLPQQCTNGGSSLPLVQCICTANSWLEGISCCIKDKCPASDVQCMSPRYQTISRNGGRRLTQIYSGYQWRAADLCSVRFTILLLSCLESSQDCPSTRGAPRV